MTSMGTGVDETGVERGSLAVEVVLMVPLVILMVTFVVFVGRVQSASMAVRHVADVAARVGSQADPADSIGRARTIAVTEMRRQRHICGDATIRARREATRSADLVTVTIRCRAPIGGLSMLGVSGPVLEASSSEVLDAHRGGS